MWKAMWPQMMVTSTIHKLCSRVCFCMMVFDATWCMKFLSLGQKLQLDKGFSNVDENQDKL